MVRRPPLYCPGPVLSSFIHVEQSSAGNPRHPRARRAALFQARYRSGLCPHGRRHHRPARRQQPAGAERDGRRIDSGRAIAAAPGVSSPNGLSPCHALSGRHAGRRAPLDRAAELFAEGPGGAADRRYPRRRRDPGGVVRCLLRGRRARGAYRRAARKIARPQKWLQGDLHRFGSRRPLRVRLRHGLQELSAQPARHLCHSAGLAFSKKELFMSELAIIGGTGLTTLKNLDITKREVVHTPFGEPSGPLTHGVLSGKKVVFLARHGYGHTIPPHMINYRANIWALHNTGVKKVIAMTAVGGSSDDLPSGIIAIPDQIIDYTSARSNTFFEDGLSHVTHIAFTEPYCEELRQLLLRGCDLTEIDRMARDGCTMVGMTGMPEAARARELGLCYATCAVIVNKAAGRGDGPITMHDIELSVKKGMDKVRELLELVVPLLDS